MNKLFELLNKLAYEIKNMKEEKEKGSGWDWYDGFIKELGEVRTDNEKDVNSAKEAESG